MYSLYKRLAVLNAERKDQRIAIGVCV
jgi:hypothetical protein